MKFFRSWWQTYRRIKRCFHHELPVYSNDYQSKSYIQGELTDLGRRKQFECMQELGGCGRIWVI